MQIELDSVVDRLARHGEVIVAWVYGSVARGEATDTSDIDLAVAFGEPHAEPWERIDALRADLQEATTRELSVIDLNRAPTALAYQVIRDGRVLLCRSDLRLHGEQQRVWSLWEEYRGHHEQRRTAP